MPPSLTEIDATLALVAEGSWAVRAGGEACGTERWRIAANAGGIVATGEQALTAPHPFPSTLAWRLTLARDWRPATLDLDWSVGEQRLQARHRAEGARWAVQIEHLGRLRTQEGDFPSSCEIEFPSHLFHTSILARRDFAVGGEHEFPVLRIGPPWMAVDPDRMRIRCVEKGVFRAGWGEVAARRYTLTLPPRPEAEGYTFWADEHGTVLESYEGPEPATPWMTLVEYRRGH
jgi:hypothetical protein